MLLINPLNDASEAMATIYDDNSNNPTLTCTQGILQTQGMLYYIVVLLLQITLSLLHIPCLKSHHYKCRVGASKARGWSERESVSICRGREK